MTKAETDIAIVGASFAGLAVAYALKGQQVSLIDPHSVGAFPKSACAVPLSLIQSFGTEEAVLEIHPELIIDIHGKVLHLNCEDPFTTLDYTRFCQLLIRQAGTKLISTRALGYAPGRVLTADGEITCRFAVDASGPPAVLATCLQPDYATRRYLGVGLEAESSRPSDLPSGLHFFLDRSLPAGYSWIFGCADNARLGVGVFNAKRHGRELRGALARLLKRFDLKAGRIHGGLVPLQLRDPVVDDLYVVGDAAGQVLPTTAEGIRPALYFGSQVGQLLRQVLAGQISEERARAAYRQEVLRHQRAYRRLEQLQRFIAFSPFTLIAQLLKLSNSLKITHHLLQRYLAAFKDAGAWPPTEPLGGEEEAVCSTT